LSIFGSTRTTICNIHLKEIDYTILSGYSGEFHNKVKREKISHGAHGEDRGDNWEEMGWQVQSGKPCFSEWAWWMFREGPGPFKEVSALYLSDF
jgi:hypothetical protein